MPDPLDSLLYEHMLLQRQAVQSIVPHGRRVVLDRSATVLLARLEAEGPMTVAQLSEAFGLDISTVHRQLAAAIKHGLIEKVRDPEGGAAWLHQPSEEGRTQLAEEFAARRAVIEEITGDWAAADVRALADLMRRFNEGSESRRGQTWPRG